MESAFQAKIAAILIKLSIQNANYTAKIKLKKNNL